MRKHCVCIGSEEEEEKEEMARAGGITNAVNVGIAVQADWENREFISHISLNVRRLFDFLVQFGTFSLALCATTHHAVVSSIH